MVRIRCDRGNSNIIADSREDFPAPRAPQMSMALRPSIRKDSRPAMDASMEPLCASFNRVHGLRECLRRARAVPPGDNGGPMTVARDSNPSTSVSNTGKASEKGCPLVCLSLDATLSTSVEEAVMFVRQRQTALVPLTPLMVMCTGFSEDGAST